MSKYLKLALAALILPTAALANDGVAAVGVGGIIFGKTDAIAMKKEVLTVSYDKISVDYAFLNESGKDLEETIRKSPTQASSQPATTAPLPA